MQEELRNLEENFQKDIQNISDYQALESLKIKYLGRKGLINQLFDRIHNLSKQERAIFGREINTFKDKVQKFIEEKISQFETKEKIFDLTFPSLVIPKGTLHILNRVTNHICYIFEKIGFTVIEGSEIEDEWHNFSALNIPLEHPSRDAFDTFYLDTEPTKKGGRFLLRSHTSPSQIRVMEKNKPPFAVISPGKVYRPDKVDASHSFMFYQIEGFAVGENINFSNLKGVLFYFAKEFFSEDVKLRFRPHFFPFTEPSAEVDVSCFICKGKTDKENRCSVCKGKGWLEILGCGMIHPKVLENCKISPKKYKGFAFGMGVDRIAMLKYQIDDIRIFYENDIKFLEQF
ncbi:MAG: phenylalanine--tRNA ligase subunit alpha [Candidatus Aenigmatarchaeota archaeon]